MEKTDSYFARASKFLNACDELREYFRQDPKLFRDDEEGGLHEKILALHEFYLASVGDREKALISPKALENVLSAISQAGGRIAAYEECNAQLKINDKDDRKATLYLRAGTKLVNEMIAALEDFEKQSRAARELLEDEKPK